MNLKISKMSFALFLFLQLIAFSSADEECLMTCTSVSSDEDVCITVHEKCDNYPDCNDGQDEEDCGCKGFECGNGWCLAASDRCNGHSDCSDVTDEMNCTKDDYRNAHPALPEEELCRRPCGLHGSCMFSANNAAVCECDKGYSGSFCETGNENSLRELHGPETPTEPKEMFVCKLTEIPIDRFCDGKIDCSDRSDESNCTRADYKRAKPHLPEVLICLMPCERGSCTFDDSEKAHCACSRYSEGTFCENLISTTTTTTTQRPTTPPVSSTTERLRPTESTTLPTTENPVSTTQDSNITTSSPEDHHNESAHESNSFVSTIALPVVAVAGVGVALWILIAKPWASGGSMSKPLVI